MLQKAKNKVVSNRNFAKKAKTKVAIVVSLFNEQISENLLTGCLSAFEDMGLASGNVKVFKVAGAFELPFMIKKIALTKKYAGVVALGCVIRGDTPHFEYVSQAASLGCLQVSLDTLCPVSFGVITVNNLEQAIERSGSNDLNKGREAALALFDTLTQLENV